MENNLSDKENSSQKNKSKKNIFLILLLLLFFITIGFVFSKNQFFDNDSADIAQETTETKDSDSSSEELPGEEAVRFLEEGEKVEITGPMSVEIISPEGETFIPSQARMYKAVITNFPKNASGECEWLFYLNQYDQEELYQQQTTRVTQDGYCTFTSTFIKSRGELRVEVRVVATDPPREKVIAEAVSERKYTVK
ncbi:MAG: hypothetical protein ACOYJ8_02165 [Patescibacteria group bacterium]|jgi:hypothetical protein